MSETLSAGGTYLSQREIVALTGKVRPKAQMKRLSNMRINAVPGGDGKLRVLRAHHDAVLSGDSAANRRSKTIEPDWSPLA